MVDNQSNRAVRTAWRLIASSYALVVGAAGLGWSSRYWMPASASFGDAIIMIAILVLCVAVGFAFAIAAAGWASWGLLKAAPEQRSAAGIAVAVSAITVLGLFLLSLVSTGIVA